MWGLASGMLGREHGLASAGKAMLTSELAPTPGRAGVSVWRAVDSSQGMPALEQLLMRGGRFATYLALPHHCCSWPPFPATAHNVVEYLETIWAALRPGGWWINLGPLLYHWAGQLSAGMDWMQVDAAPAGVFWPSVTASTPCCLV